MLLATDIFAGCFPTGIVYANRRVEEHGDYKRLAFLSFASLELSIEKDCPAELRDHILADAASVQAKRGETYKVSSCGQTVLLGSAIIARPTTAAETELGA